MYGPLKSRTRNPQAWSTVADECSNKHPSCYNTTVCGIWKTWLSQLWKISPSARSIVNEPEVQVAQTLPMATVVGSLVTQILSQWFSSGHRYISPDAGEKCGMICKLQYIIAAAGTSGWWGVLLEKICFKSQCINIVITEHCYLAVNVFYMVASWTISIRRRDVFKNSFWKCSYQS